MFYRCLYQVYLLILSIMHVNRNFSVYKPSDRINKDGKVSGIRQVDQYFTLNFNRSAAGFHSSDVDLLDKASKLSDGQVRYQALLQHFKLLSSKEENKGKSPQELLDGLKPAYMQTPAEMIAFLEQMTFNFQNINKNENTEEKVTESASVESDSAGSSE